jgi:hypothetical protein
MTDLHGVALLFGTGGGAAARIGAVAGIPLGTPMSLTNAMVSRAAVKASVVGIISSTISKSMLRTGVAMSERPHIIIFNSSPVIPRLRNSPIVTLPTRWNIKFHIIKVMNSYCKFYLIK